MSSERQLNDTKNPWWGEHLHRYQEALAILGNKQNFILDIACGSGFGSHYLSKHGHTVIGGDISEETIADCRKKFEEKNLVFNVLDGAKLCINDNVFDAVISFETIEHTTSYQAMLNEFKRVTKKDGLIIISTPNFIVNSPKGFIENPFHTQEWTYNELMEILNHTFSEVKLYGQEYVRYKQPLQLNYKIAKTIETILYKRGFRKLPLMIQDAIMNCLIKQPMYPMANNYSFTAIESEIKKCKTFFAICKV